MDLKEAIWGRRSIRKFKNEKVPSNVLQAILEAGVQAPSSCNQQMFYFISIEDEKLKKRLLKDAGFKWIDRIPHPYFVVTDKRFGDERYANIQGASATIQNMLLYAYSISIGSCWIAGYGDKAIVKKLLNIPKYFHILGCVGFGYPDEKPIKPIKRNVCELLFHNRLNLPLEKTNNPDDWIYEEIQSLSSRAIFAKSPDIGYYHIFPMELEKQLDYIFSNLGHDVLYIDDISGIYLFKLAAKKPNSRFYMLSHSQKIIKWMEEKVKHHKLSNIEFIYSNNLKLNKRVFDTVLCLDQVNRLPDKNRQDLIDLSYNCLKNDGNLILSFLNKSPICGFLFRNGVARRYGPEISLSSNYISRLVNKFKIVDKVGFNLLPSPRLFFKIGVPGKYTFFNGIMRYVAKYNLLEDSVSHGFMANFATTNIIIAKK